jgi:hypothetical protein
MIQYLLVIMIVFAAQPTAPVNVVAVWNQDDSFQVSWMQHSDADRVCISGTNNTIWNVLECVPSAPGAHTMRLALPWQIGAEYYYITEFQGDMMLGEYGAFVLDARPPAMIYPIYIALVAM